MRPPTLFWMWSLVMLLFVLVSSQTQKVNVHWGPQSMMYLKGKHGRRFVSESVFTHELQAWYEAVQGYRRLRSRPELKERFFRFLKKR